MFDFLKKDKDQGKTQSKAQSKGTSYDQMLQDWEKGRKLLGEFTFSRNFRGFKRIHVSAADFTVTDRNLRKLIKEKPVIRGDGDLMKLDLTGSRISVYGAKTKQGDQMLLVYIDGLFVGRSIIDANDKTAAIYSALKKHKTTAAHIELEFMTGRVYQYGIYLMINGAE